ncbi:NAD(P)-dependent oxidoreductase [Bradyrhizobium prioriisuperbiae]|uniref:NAD(P)-dependent oxidoreductase n=1 Tax=Bradyrhizobium prioriisuperbiae TaxID=2854389 RepID=UPI0028E35CE8|nr:NAD(P)-dependent oxidoreductase [Bradyrhizobium prioritasuperba]
METLGYIGLGLMGLPMTRRLLAAGHRVSAWNRSQAKLAEVVQSGAQALNSPAEVAASASIIFMCLTDAKAVEAVVFGADGLASVAGEGKVVVDFSSIHPDATRSIAERLRAKSGMHWIDAPVSGGTKGAAEGTLAVMAGGDAADIARVTPYVLAMARGFTHMGPTGAGQTTKLCNQVIVGCTMAVLAEATRLAVNAGIDARRLPEALKGGFADSIPLQLFVPRMVDAIHSPPLGGSAIMLKDLDTVLDVAQSNGTPVPMAGLAAQLFRMLQATRGDDAEALEIYKLSGVSKS